jgi:transcription termination factor Rho
MQINFIFVRSKEVPYSYIAQFDILLHLQYISRRKVGHGTNVYGGRRRIKEGERNHV